MRRRLIVANWKMHGSLEKNSALLDVLVHQLSVSDNREFAICPPYVYIPSVATALVGSGIATGAQNVAAEVEGAYTGEVSVSMLADLGCRYVIVGHSERRALYGEDDAVVAEKFVRAQEGGLQPILCVGESLVERQAGQALAVIQRQLQAVIDRVGVVSLARAVIAYEPVWAIGTGETAAPEQAQEVHAFIRGCLAETDSSASELTILYGGSVKPDNAAELFAQDDIDGALVGGASLDAAAFAAICMA